MSDLPKYIISNCVQPYSISFCLNIAGYFERYQLERLQTKFAKISCCVVEPSHLITEYQDAISKDENGLGETREIIYDWRKQTFQGYMKNRDLNFFDFISVFHAMYFLGDPEKAITDLYSLLKPGGIMVILVLTGKETRDQNIISSVECKRVVSAFSAFCRGGIQLFLTTYLFDKNANTLSLDLHYDKNVSFYLCICKTSLSN